VSDERCAGCGRAVAGGTAGCRAEFEALVGRDFAEPACFTVRRLLVDAYSLQHPNEFCRSAKSLAAHRAGLCDLLERGASRATGTGALRAWLDGRRDLAKPALPAERGSLTLADVRGVETPSEHARRVEAWARSIWAAYAPLHALARRWLDQALATRRARRR
jgi:hypothetical protein